MSVSRTNNSNVLWNTNATPTPSGVGIMRHHDLLPLGPFNGKCLGILLPFVTAEFTKQCGTVGNCYEKWQLVFAIAASVQIFNIIFFSIFASAEQQDWATPSGDQEQLISKKNHTTSVCNPSQVEWPLSLWSPTISLLHVVSQEYDFTRENLDRLETTNLLDIYVK